MNNLNIAIKTFGGHLRTHSPSILTGIGVAGVFATAIFASKATLRADEILDGDDREKYLQSYSESGKANNIYASCFILSIASIFFSLLYLFLSTN